MDKLMSRARDELNVNRIRFRQQWTRFTMVDYSKWDHLEVSSDEQDVEPCVTRFDKPQSITIGKSDDNIQSSAPALAPVSTSSIAPASTPDEKSGINGDILDYSIAIRNGNATDRYLWSQTKDNIVAHIFVESDVKAKDVHLKLQTSKSELDDTTPMTAWPAQLDERIGREFELTIKENMKISGKFPYPVKLDDEYIFWELKTFSSVSHLPPCQTRLSSGPLRFLILSLTKSPPLANTTVWWDRFIDSDSPIDVTSLIDRKSSGSFKKVWDEAQRLFVEKMHKKREAGDQRTEI